MTKLRSQLVSESGGLVYHLRQLRFGRRWVPFREVVHGWLERWNPSAEQLVVVGPSAGWTLPLPWLRRFRRLVALEPDPLARQLLAWRLRSRCEFVALDVLGDGGPAALRDAFPRAAVLFANVLGQVLPDDDDAATRRLDDLQRALCDREWASFHDLASTATAPTRAHGVERTDGTLDDVVRAFWAPPGAPTSVDLVELTDHRTWALQRPHDEATVWELTPRAWQLVGWTSRGP
jgi:hypothetical protein